MPNKLFLLTRTTRCRYDQYDSAVVSAPDELTARNMNISEPWDEKAGKPIDWVDAERIGACGGAWVSKLEHVEAEYLGETEKPTGVICSSFNAG